MFKQIIKIIWQQRSSNAWIWGEILLVSICLWYVVDDLYVKSWLYYTPIGYDISNVYTIDLGALTEENHEYHPQNEYGSTLGEDLLTLVSRIKTHPGVEAVGISSASLPYSYWRNYSNLMRIRNEMNDTLEIGTTRRYMATPDYLRVFRYTTLQGNTETLANNLNFNQIIISQDVEEQLYPEGHAMDKVIDFNLNDSLETRIGGVMNPIRFGDFETYSPTFILPMSEKMIAEALNEERFQGTQITLRTTTAEKDFISNFKKNMANILRYNNIYLLDVRSFEDIRSKYIRNDINNSKMYLATVFFLLTNIFLGIVGTFFFRTQHRQSEMGLRIALGSTKENLRSIFIVEGLTILMLAFLPASVIALNLGLKEIVNVDIMPFSLQRFMICQMITFLLMSFMIVLGIWYPAQQACRINPAETLRNE